MRIGAGSRPKRQVSFIPGESDHAIHTSVVHRSARAEGSPDLPVLAAVALASALALTATACNSGDADAGGEESATAAADDGKLKIPDDIKDQLKEHGIDIDKWKDGAWKDWSKDDWLREAQDYVNPIIEGLWDPDRMREAEEPDQGSTRATSPVTRA
ncbi:hypothetical protein SHKM778_22970 [Streptomyces sp. KM77-8]|uniref:Uncharacterized protein n=1 Tax=Streptomyces haneummycinicus TaxID=3074435 RepID=A0AAT9HES4_9ACTN